MVPENYLARQSDIPLEESGGAGEGGAASEADQVEGEGGARTEEGEAES